MPLRTTTVGKDGPSVPAIGVGLMSLGHAYGHAGSDEERLAFLDHLYEVGETFWDEADLYGDSEEVVGKWMTANPEKRKEIYLATKFGFVSRDPIKLRSDPEWIEQAITSSLKKMKTDYVDLYYCHRTDGVTPIELTVRKMVELKEQGKIRQIGLSEVTLKDLKRAHAVHPIAAVQSEYSPWALEPEKTGVLQFCQDQGITFVAYSPLGRGMLGGTIRKPEDVEGTLKLFPRFSPENFHKNFDIVEKMEKIAEKKGVKAFQLGLAWLMTQGNGKTVLPIFGTKTISRIKENLVGLDVTLTKQEIKEIRDLVDEAGKMDFGERYPAGMEWMQLRDTPPLKE